ncbi:MAG: extracellular solute-binding protein [candidate division NC10 bacterium]|nr:extracellular solute-binding protein [candidate division NC10 bacterium]MBI4412885.1 extracellular solute-binding protein [candidate division NC10 bacterium]
MRPRVPGGRMLGILVVLVFGFVFAWVALAAAQQVTLNVVTAGDTNMHDLQKLVFAPEFEKRNPGVKINAVGSGPGDPGSRVIANKLKSQKDAGVAKWDIDVAIVHQIVMSELIQQDLVAKYAPEIATYKLMTAADGRNALGFNVEGYVMPMFHSQVVLAYNPEMVKSPPNTFEELLAWIKANPKRFGYNGVKGGMSGVAFTTGWTYWKTGQYEQYAKGPYDKTAQAAWPAAIKELKGLPVTLTTGNNDTLDRLNRGEIAMGPVWVDMLINQKNEGRMDPKIRMKLISPGFPGQPMYLVVPKNAANYQVAKKYVEFITSPEIQARVIVERNGWYPGIDGQHVLPHVSEKAKGLLFQDVPPDVLAKYGLSFPLSAYFKDLMTAYEEN